MKRQPKTNERRRICPVSAQSPAQTLSRTKVAYWRTRLEKVKSKKGTSSPDYSVRVVFKNKRVRFPLHTSNKESAASKAAQIFTFLIENGWEDTIEKYKPQTKKSTEVLPSLGNTVGDLITANLKYSSARPQTLQAYTKAFRRIVSGVMLMDESNDFLSRSSCGNDEWRIQVDAITLDELTPHKIQCWKQLYLKKNSKTTSAKKKAITTINSLIRNSKALFSKKLIGFLEKDIALPSPLPFDGITMEKPSSQRYHSKIDAKTVLAQAHEELKETEPESYKMLLLALVCGLRVSEVDYLLWGAFDFSTGLLIIEDTEYHQLKSEDSAGEIALSEDMKKLFKEYKKEASSQFVIESKGNIERSTTTRSYRCRGAIEFLKKWLREHGVHAQKPIHELRKEIGSILASEEGIFAASRYLRHSDIRITSSIYADQKNRVVPSIGNSLFSE